MLLVAAATTVKSATAAGGVVSTTLISAVSGLESKIPSLTIKVTVVVPTANVTDGLTPVAAPPGHVQL